MDTKEKKEIKNIHLADLKTGDIAVITRVAGHGAFRKRITEMGFVKGKKIQVIKNAPLQDPIEYAIMGYHVSLRRSEASLIDVVSEEDARFLNKLAFQGTIINDKLKSSVREKGDTIQIALVGNPNCGKTTLFNFASGSHEKVGNYSGVTVDAKEAKLKFANYNFNITDLPGTYSITDYTPEELYVREHITNNKPDIVVNVVDASNLERNLFLTTQLIDMDIKVVIALNMYDELEKKGASLKYRELGRMMGIPIIPTVAVKGTGIATLLNKIIEVYENKDATVRHIHINYGTNIEEAIAHIEAELSVNKDLAAKYHLRDLALKVLQGDKTTLELLKAAKNSVAILDKSKKEIAKLEKEYAERTETIITDAKYGFIAGALKETYIASKEEVHKQSKEIDHFITHKIWGIPIFLFFMWLMFQATFTLGSYPMGWIDAGVHYLSNWLSGMIPAGSLHDLIINGVIGGVGGVIVFLPNILILFFFISLMEDTGYMARVSFIMDKLMHKIGLHGKSFIPLLMGFGCNVPAIMATRTLENKKDRILTMLITPFMSCSARLPVYVLLISAIFPEKQGLVLFFIYFTGITIAILVALLLKKTIFAKQVVPFVMELPPYRIPTLKNTGVHMWHKAAQYLHKMGGVILLASILIWALNYFPRNEKSAARYDAMTAKINADKNLSSEVKTKTLENIQIRKEAERQESSYIGRMGHFLEPALQPLGFDWKIGVSIITGLAAKEIVVSSMGILYQADRNADEKSGNLIQKIRQQEHSYGDLKGQKVFSKLVAMGFMLFVLIYFPCVAVIAAIKKESSWKWALFSMFYTTAIAWVVAFATYQIGSMFGA